MGSAVNILTLSPALADFAQWTVSSFTVLRRASWGNLLGAVGILALFFSIVSPDDDLFQPELLRPTIPSVGVSVHTRLVPRRTLADLSINAFVAAGDHTQDPRIGVSLVTNQPLELETHSHAPITTHSPPVIS
jgi:hypothetical protein